MYPVNILVAEDNLEILKSLESGLREEGYTVDTVETGLEALYKLDNWSYDLAVLDIKLPELCGLSVLERYRRQGGTTPVLLLTAKGSLEDKLKGFEHGADDYLVKPFVFNELCARINALIRRSSKCLNDVIRIGSLEINIRERSICVEGVATELPKQEYDILVALAARRGRVISRDFLYDRISTDEEVNPNLLEVLIYNLRKLGGKELIKTIRGQGYMIPNTDMSQE